MSKIPSARSNSVPGSPFFIGIFWLLAMPDLVRSSPHEQRLIQDLMLDYNTLERPVGNESEALLLKLGLTLQQISAVDEKNQLLITNVWLNFEWNDVNMRWNRSEYGGVSDIRIPPHKLWKPDVLMYNSADEAFDGTYPVNVIVNEDGKCLYNPPGIFLSTCKIDITWFPFDDQGRNSIEFQKDFQLRCSCYDTLKTLLIGIFERPVDFQLN